MSVIFTLPRQVPLAAGVLLPGGKLTFTITGTTTAQNTYQDQALTTPHANPVVADSNGVFPAIYLSPTLPNYRVKLTTAANVTIYQEDDYPSNQNVQQSLRLESTNPFVFLYDTDGTANARKYRVRAAGNAFEVQASNDAETVFTTILQFTGGVLYSNATEVAVTSSGTFTGTLTGMTGSVTGTINYRRINNVVTMWVTALISGTSNATNMELTGIPAELNPTVQKTVPCCVLGDNSISVNGEATVTIGNSIALFPYAVSGTKIILGAFVNSGTKGIGSGWSITYPLN